MPEKTVVAFALGDPAAISPELAAKVIAAHDPEAATLLVVGDARLLELGAQHAGLSLDILSVTPEDIGTERPAESLFVDLGNCDPSAIEIGVASADGGRSALENFRTALLAANEGFADAVYFTPFNKHAMRLAEDDYVDEIGFVTKTIDAPRTGSEFNVLDEVWNARVTSHVPLSQVASLINEDRIFNAMCLTAEVMEGAGYRRPRIGVAALNPHAGDGGNFGHEDEAFLRPAVVRGKKRQLAVEGPIPSDTVFVRAMKGEFDAVLTMYHDQGQIAMKLIGFDRGVTLIAGYPFPIATPAHGTAYDIAGQGIANDGAAKKALELAIRLARPAAEAPEPAVAFAQLVERARSHAAPAQEPPLHAGAAS